MLVTIFSIFGAFVFNALEGRDTEYGTFANFTEAWYYCLITITTVGYGDFAPASGGGKFFCIIFCIFGFQFVINMVSQISAMMAVPEDSTMTGTQQVKAAGKRLRLLSGVMFIILLLGSNVLNDEELIQSKEDDAYEVLIHGRDFNETAQDLTVDWYDPRNPTGRYGTPAELDYYGPADYAASEEDFTVTCKYSVNVYAYSKFKLCKPTNVERRQDYGVWFYVLWTTFTTIGYGDVFPATGGGRIFLIFLLPLGLASIGLVIEAALALNKAASVQAKEAEKALAKGGKRFRFKKKKKGKKAADAEATADAEEAADTGPADDKAAPAEEEATGAEQDLLNPDDAEEEPEPEPEPPKDSIKTVFKKMAVSYCLNVVYQWVGAAIFMACESEESFVQAWYWAAMTCTTIGYGDVSPATTPGRVFFIFYSVGGAGLTATLLTLITNLVDAINAEIDRDIEKLEQKAEKSGGKRFGKKRKQQKSATDISSGVNGDEEAMGGDQDKPEEQGATSTNVGSDDFPSGLTMT
jgi:voltage-gated potassium channel Kch